MVWVLRYGKARETLEVKAKGVAPTPERKGRACESLPRLADVRIP